MTAIHVDEIIQRRYRRPELIATIKLCNFTGRKLLILGSGENPLTLESLKQIA